MVGLDDLRSLFQSKLFYDSIYLTSCTEVKEAKASEALCQMCCLEPLKICCIRSLLIILASLQAKAGYSVIRDGILGIIKQGKFIALCCSFIW